MNLPFEDNTFDYVTVGFGLRNVPDYLGALKEMHRVLKPGGKVVCLETSQPTLPVFKQVYSLYFKFVMPIFGKMFAKSKEEYEWLQQSTFNFPDKQTLKRLFFEAGLNDIKVRSFTGGVAAMHLGYKEKILPKVINVAKLNINNEIKKVEDRLQHAIKSSDQTLEDAAFHLLSSGGKRVRPVFVILSSQFGDSKDTSENTYRVAVALELIHMATLVHDDVIDKSDKRRGRPTISKKWDQTTAILTGNFYLL